MQFELGLIDKGGPMEATDERSATAASRRPLQLLDLPQELLQGIAEAMLTREASAFSRSNTACQAAASNVLMLANVVQQLKIGKQIGDGIGKTRVGIKSIDLSVSVGIKSIGMRAFYKCISMTSIVLPAGLVTVGLGAFFDCISLTSISMPLSCKSIGPYAFHNCAFVSITLPIFLTELGHHAFSHCNSLTAITIPDPIDTIYRFTFGDCIALKSITLPAKLITIESYAFEDCTALNSIILPDCVTDIQDLAFTGCVALDAPSRDRIRAICPDARF